MQPINLANENSLVRVNCHLGNSGLVKRHQTPPFFDNSFVMVNSSSVLAIYLDPDHTYVFMI